VRPSAAARGYDEAWRRRRLDFLVTHPVCRLCGMAATIPDHFPQSRKQLVAAGVVDPDDERYLRPLCEPCHRTETAKRQPGGWTRNHR
jgi:5-methylcytosine-specific restriction protein A